MLKFRGKENWVRITQTICFFNFAFSNQKMKTKIIKRSSILKSVFKNGQKKQISNQKNGKICVNTFCSKTKKKMSII